MNRKKQSLLRFLKISMLTFLCCVDECAFGMATEHSKNGPTYRVLYSKVWSCIWLWVVKRERKRGRGEGKRGLIVLNSCVIPEVSNCLDNSAKFFIDKRGEKEIEQFIKCIGLSKNGYSSKWLSLLGLIVVAWFLLLLRLSGDSFSCHSKFH